jgi:hypothetical protein
MSEDNFVPAPAPKPVEKVQKAVPVEPTPAPVKAERSSSEILAELMLKREARAAAKEEAEEAAKQVRDKQRDQNARSHFEDHLAKQTNCKHLKGGKNRIRTQAKDYAVYLHTFINSERIITCFLCGMKWKPKDTREFLVRYGKQIANHTHLGWEDAVQMASETSNQSSSSEIPMNATPVITSNTEV